MADAAALPLRADLAARFLDAAGVGSWPQAPIAADASSRRYTRLTHQGRSLVLMDADPAAGHDTAHFARLARWLRASGLAAPEVLAEDTERGFLLLEDLGTTDIAGRLRQYPEEAADLYEAATALLAALRDLPPPEGLPRLTPEAAGEMVAITGTHYAACDPAPLSAEITRLFHRHAPEADRLALRDYHAENLIWRPERQGHDRLGLLDFQNAFLAPEGYDLASLLRDVRREVDPPLADRIARRYAAATGQGEEFLTRLAVLGAQRNLRILGVFARLARTRGRTRHLDLMPRVWTMLHRDLAHPDLAHLRALVEAQLPPPEPDHLERLLA